MEKTPNILNYMRYTVIKIYIAKLKKPEETGKARNFVHQKLRTDRKDNEIYGRESCTLIFFP